MKEQSHQKVKSVKIKKMSYKTPKVTIYGSVKKLTAAKKGSKFLDGTGIKKS